jgi:putative ABC transport system permease protein
MVFLNLILESLQMAWHSISRNKVRTSLTLLGITIGIFAIISVFTALDALENGIRENVASLGDDIIYVQKWPWSFEDDYKWWEYLKRPVPRIADYEEILKKAQTVDAAVFSVSTGRTVKYKNNSFGNGGIWANTEDFEKVKAFEIEKGRYFSPYEFQSGKNVCIIGYTIATQLFGNEDPVDKFVKVDGRKIKVVGMTKKEGTSIVGGSMDDVVLIPLNYARNIFDIKSDRLNPFMMIKAKKGVPLDQMKDELRSILRKKHNLKPLQADDFSLNQASLIISGIEKIFLIINIAGWIIGGFSIIVGGFGIANIMFVTVRERTNQIGIQKALGAKRFFILIEFLFEAVILSVLGGLLGLFFVFLASVAASKALDFEMALTMGNILLGVLTSAIIGLLAGLIPAYTAARLNPVDAINTTF